ncbi:hypothetical protein LUZ61_006228 [Rhynchospora tenuis]|uniref:Uncharacterized protein n=1 Tax=Rhynchospora tenuis TaxID=198213 RepID=A0AAD6EVE6_9POAL|nr:hypothetical protein LUZ61_006228 [Rhynchospora tenuis]
MSVTGIQEEVEYASCDCCGLIEECTPAYISLVRSRYNGRWICGLCGEAVEEEITRSPEPAISSEQALERHVSFCRAVRSPPAEHLITAVRNLLRKSRSAPASPRRKDDVDGPGGSGLRPLIAE